jgi:hypothetical protein
LTTFIGNSYAAIGDSYICRSESRGIHSSGTFIEWKKDSFRVRNTKEDGINHYDKTVKIHFQDHNSFISDIIEYRTGGRIVYSFGTHFLDGRDTYVSTFVGSGRIVVNQYKCDKI